MNNSSNNMKMVKLGEVCEVIAGQSPPSDTYNDKGNGLPFYQGKTDFGRRYPVVRKWCSDPVKIAEEGDILISVRAPVGPTNVATEKCCIGRGLSAIRCPDSVYMEYLLHFLRWFESRLSAQGKGAIFSAITQKDLKAIQFPLPPRPEQQRIAAILDGADEARRKRCENLSLYDDLIRSLFLKTFGDPVSNPMGWGTKRLGDWGDVVTGNTPSRKDPENYGDHIEWIKSDNINTPYYLLTKAREMLSDQGLKLARTAPPESLLVTCIAGSKSCIGNVAVTDRTVSFNQQINALIPDAEGITPFLYYHFIVGKKLIQQASTNGMKGLVSKSSFSNVEFINPPINLQKCFSAKAQEINAQKAREQALYEQHDDLFNALLQRAFKGEL